jgi:ferredoxin-NADP reductase/DMSO/TMAO reductase YedYZ heme-binding membrane subunit
VPITDATTDTTRPPPRFHPDRQLVRRVVLVNGAVPITLLAYDAWQRQLGANCVNFAIHTTGLLALLFFILSLAVTPLKRLTGYNELVASRRALGLYGFFYLVIHFGIFFVLDRSGSLSSTLHEILKRRYLQIGTIALLLFVPLAITATDAMITRLGPRRWKRLHRLSYLATSLGSLHYVLLVKSDVRQPLAFAGVLGLLLGTRIVAHFGDRARRAEKRRSVWSGELRVSSVTDETHDVRTFRLVLPGGGALPFTHRPGQYMNLALDLGGHRVNRSYTIASAPTHPEYVEITVKKASDGWASGHLHEMLREGTILKVSAPAGRFVFDGQGANGVLLLAGGVGITPLMAIVRTLTDRDWPGRIELLYSVKTQADIVFGRELEGLASRFPNLHVYVTLTREAIDSPWLGARGPITGEILQRLVPDLRAVPVYLCGPAAMMEAMKGLLAGLGAPANHVHVEAFVSPPRAPAMEDSVATEERAEADESPARAAGALTVQFAASGEMTEMEDGQTLLEAAERVGVDIPFDCRAGICGQCKTKLLRGRVVMDVQDALTDDDRKKDFVLACQARPVRDVVVDA